MAKAPKCKVCGDRVWGNCGHPRLTGSKRAINEERLTDAINKAAPAINEMVASGAVRMASEIGSRSSAGASSAKKVLGNQGEVAVGVLDVRGEVLAGVSAGGSREARTPNRRKRDDYNEYMRDYMRQIRLVEREKKRGS